MAMESFIIPFTGATKAYIKSLNISVFPCAYRGIDDTGSSFDPEARVNSEHNFTHLPDTVDKRTYFISKTTANYLTTIKFTIDGYLFIIKNLTADDIAWLLNFRYWGIKYFNLAFTDYSSTVTKVLDTFENVSDGECGTKLILDTKTIKSSGSEPITFSEYAFIGLQFSDHVPDATKGETLWDAYIEYGEDTYNYPITTKKIESEQLGTAITNRLVNGTGDNSVKLGQTTTADQESMVAVGEYNTSEAGDLFVVGNGTSTSKSNVVQVNRDKVKINKQTDITGDTSISGTTKIIGNTEITGTEILSGDLNINCNKFKVNATDGKVEAAGSLEIATDKFKVDAADGNTTIAGTLTQGDTTDKQQVTFNGNVDAKNGLDVTGENLTVGGDNFTATTDGNLTAKGVITLGATNGTVTLSKADKQTEVKGSLNVNQTTDICGDLKINTNKFAVTASNGNTTIAGTLTQGDTTDKQQVTFNGNVDAKNGLDVSGTFTVSGTSNNFNVTESGKLVAKGKIVLGETNGEVTLSKAGEQTEVKGSLKVDEALTTTGTINGIAITNDTTDRICLVQVTSETTTELAVASGKTVNIDNNLSVEGDTTVNTALTVGKTEYTGAVSIYSNGADATGIYGPNGGEITLPANATATGAYVFAQTNTGGTLTSEMVSYATSNKPKSVVYRDSDCNFAAGTITATLSGTASHANLLKPHRSSTVSAKSIWAGGITTGVKVWGESFGDTDTKAGSGIGNIIFKLRPGEYTTSSAELSELCVCIDGDYYSMGKKVIHEGDNTLDKEITIDQNFTATAHVITASSFTATSDRRLKENIVEYVPEKSILDLQVKKFDFIKGPKNQIGCIAQDLQEICPELVYEGKDGYLSIQESKLVYLLLDEVKKLRKEVNELKK